MHFTPVIPEPPTPEGRSPRVQPPVIPSFSPESTPAPPPWMKSQQAGPNYAAAYPMGPGGQTPFLGVPGMHGMAGMPGMHGMAGIPGSYFMPSVALPGQMPTSPNMGPPPTGFSADWTGFPQVVNPSPSPAGTPWHPAAAFPGGAPATAFNAFQQPLPGMGYGVPPGWGQPPAAAFGTPFVPANAFPAGWPPQAAAGWPPSATPFQQAGVPPGYATPGPAAAAPPAAAHSRPSRAGEGQDRFDKWSEDNCYGPVLDAFLVKVVKAKVELNPLLAPPPDRPDERPYLKWNMLFPTAQCQRSSDPGHRSWADGRHAPATWPRVKSLRILSHNFPWELQVQASDIELGVTCGDVIEAIHDFMYGRVSNQQLENATAAHKRLVGQSYWHNRSTAHGVPGGRLYNTLLRCDWLGLQTMFGGIVQADERLIQDLACGADLPCTFELKCLQRYPMTEAEIREHEARENLARQEEDRARRAARSRGTSRTTSRAPSRATSRTRSHQNTSTSDSDEDS